MPSLSRLTATAALCAALTAGATAVAAAAVPDSTAVPVADSGSSNVTGSAAAYGVDLIQIFLQQTGSSALARSLDQLECTLGGHQFSNGTCIIGGI
ncbi:hypothetical protein [Nocardia sp. NBC_01327]|uniref:hypothetical protein n=1 Tax=Nocardia sp. NBC_01327 TaxID=2903593 RepID=UPI002E146914|nr:hypothetical protein OG326_29305 [Nocardia sp. NBC_01327]